MVNIAKGKVIEFPGPTSIRLHDRIEAMLSIHGITSSDVVIFVTWNSDQDEAVKSYMKKRRYRIRHHECWRKQ